MIPADLPPPGVSPLFSQGFPGVFSGFSQGFPRVFAGFSGSFPRVFPGFSGGFPWVFPGFSGVFQGVARGFPVFCLFGLFFEKNHVISKIKEKERKKIEIESRNLSKIVSVLLSALVKRFFVSRMRDFYFKDNFNFVDTKLW